MRKLLALIAGLALTLPSAAFAAIAYDTSGSNSGTTSFTISLTIASGASLFVFVGSEESVLPTSVVWNSSEALTQVGQTGYYKSGWYYLANPTSGTHDVTVTIVGTAGANAISLTGMAASSAIGADHLTDWGSVGATTGSDTITTATANSWVLNGLYVGGGGGGTITATGANQTKRADVDAGAYSISASTQTTTTAGGYTNTWTWTPTTNWGMNSIEVKPAAAAATASPTSPPMRFVTLY